MSPAKLLSPSIAAPAASLTWKALHLELVHRFGKDRCLRIQFPNQQGDIITKDANECLVQLGRNVLIETIKNAVPYPIDGIYTVKNYKKEVLDIYNGNMGPEVNDEPLPLEMRDIEHCLCEFDKYERVRLGQGRPRAKYKPREYTEDLL